MSDGREGLKEKRRDESQVRFAGSEDRPWGPLRGKVVARSFPCSKNNEYVKVKARMMNLLVTVDK